MQERWEQIQRTVVTAAQMQEIEGRTFAEGMPVSALMEKVAGLVTRRILELYPPPAVRLRGIKMVGVLVGSGHNGGDALVVARELHFRGFNVYIYCPFSQLKDLTAQHAQYVQSLGIPFFEQIELLEDCDFIIDGLFGFGLNRNIGDRIAEAIAQVNQWHKPVLSIDLPSGLHADTGEVLGIAVRATRTFCLGLWKLGLLQDRALEYAGATELIDFDLPLEDVQDVVGQAPKIKRMTAKMAIGQLPIKRSPAVHKYQQGHLLLICGSRKYAGGAILTALGARASGAGMLSVAVPESLKMLLAAQLPEALIIGCPETASGAIARLPEEINLDAFSAIACGSGLTPEAISPVEAVLASDRPLVLDADGLNILAQLKVSPILSQRHAPTVLTPHAGEFKRLFPSFPDPVADRMAAASEAAKHSRATILLKGARTAIADPTGAIIIIPESTPALARGGSGDVLAGLLGGILAQAAATNPAISLLPLAASAAWWHAQAGILAAQERTELGVDAYTLVQYLIPSLPKV